MPIFATSEMANPVFSVWSKTGPTLLRFENKPHPSGCGFAIFEKIRKKQSLAERELHGVGEDVAYEKR